MRGLKRRVVAVVLAAAMVLSLNRGVSAETLEDLVKANSTVETQVENEPSGELSEASKEDSAENSAENPAENPVETPAENPEQVEDLEVT